MKIMYKGEHGLVIAAEHPDESLKAHIAERLREALVTEQNAFLREVEVAMRKLKAGQKRVLLSKPIRVEIEKIDDAVDEKIFQLQSDNSISYGPEN